MLKRKTFLKKKSTINNLNLSQRTARRRRLKQRKARLAARHALQFVVQDICSQ